MRWLAILILAVFAAAGVWIATRSTNGSDMPTANPVAASFIANYVSDDGRIADTGNGGITHSEGQGYGLLMAEGANDRQTFDRILSWTEQNLGIRDDALFAWRWDPEENAVTDRNNATDGEILIAWALLRAHDRWGADTYRTRALAILSAVEAGLLRDSALGEVILPGSVGFETSDGVVVNLSYWVFPAFERFAREGRTVWNDVAESGYRLANDAAFGAYGLSPEWTLIAREGQTSPASGWPAEFGYNAIRLPLHVCWAQPNSHNEARTKILARYAAFWNQHSPIESDRWSLETNEPVGWPAPPAFGSIAELTAACVNVSESAPTASIEPDEPYYSAALKGLVSLAVRDLADQDR